MLGDQIRAVQGKPLVGGPPSKAKYLDSFLFGFEIAANQAFVNPDSVFVTAVAAGAIAGVSDVGANVLAGEVPDVRAALTDFAVTTVVGLVLNPASMELFNQAGNATLAEDVASFASTLTSAALTAEVGLLIQAYSP